MQENTLVNRLIKWRNSQDKPLKKEADSNIDFEASDVNETNVYIAHLIEDLIGVGGVEIDGDVVYLIMEDFVTCPNWPENTTEEVDIPKGIWEAYKVEYPIIKIIRVKYPQMTEVDKIGSKPLSYFAKDLSDNLDECEYTEVRDFPHYLVSTFGWPEAEECNKFLDSLPEL